MEALEKSKYEQSLEYVRRFTAMAEKELELYYRNRALYGDPNNRNSMSIMENPSKVTQGSRKFKMVERKSVESTYDSFSAGVTEAESDSTDQSLSELQDDFEDEGLSTSESDSEDGSLSDFDSEENHVSSSRVRELSSTMLGSSSIV